VDDESGPNERNWQLKSTLGEVYIHLFTHCTVRFCVVKLFLVSTLSLCLSRVHGNDHVMLSDRRYFY
jgi:hypothetical protein